MVYSVIWYREVVRLNPGPSDLGGIRLLDAGY